MKNSFTFIQRLLLYLILGLSILFVDSCKTNDTLIPEPVLVNYSADVPIRWAKMSLKIAEKTPKNSPTYASRGFGFLGLTMYETVVNGYPDYKSMVGQLTDLNSLPQPVTGQTYNWVLSLNAGQSSMLKNMYEQTSDVNKTSIDSLEALVVSEISKTETKDVVDKSIAYGQEVAKAIFEYSKTDGGYQGYKANFPTDFQLVVSPGSWTPPIFSQSPSKLPLHPYWGQHRTFVAANNNLPIPKMLDYSTQKTSAYYLQFVEVYNKSQVLTDAEKATAVWWSDDPSQTFTPPGHSYSLASIAVKTANANLIQAARTFAGVGTGIADAFVICWKCKFNYMVERPSSFIRKNIEPYWTQFWPEPPFPAFYSGHAVQGATTATVLTSIYGDNFKFTDNSHEGRPDDAITGIPYKNRNFNSFNDAAAESANSRFLGGIHTKYDNEIGLAEGKKIGANVSNLQWKK